VSLVASNLSAKMTHMELIVAFIIGATAFPGNMLSNWFKGMQIYWLPRGPDYFKQESKNKSPYIFRCECKPAS